MGWYTRGPGGFEYKYGDLFELARASGLGRLGLIPRIRALAEDEPFDDDEFLGPLLDELAIELPGVSFDGDALPLRPGADPGEVLEDLAAALQGHRQALSQALAGEEAEGVVDLTLTADRMLTIVEADRPELERWLNAGLESEVFTAAALAEGVLDGPGGGYEPPARLAEVVRRFALEDAPRHLALFAWAHASLGEPEAVEWRFFQPGDELEEASLGRSRNRRAVVLFRPEEHPILDLIARLMDVSPAVRSAAFYFHPTDLELVLPPEPEVVDDEVERGMVYCQLLAQRVVSVLPGVTEVFPILDAENGLAIGWHPTASREDLARAAKDTEVEALALEDLLASSEAADLPGELRLAALTRSVDPDLGLVLGSIVEGTGALPESMPEALLPILVDHLLGLDVPAAMAERLAVAVGRSLS